MSSTVRTALLVAVVAIAFRGVACWKFSSNLSDDRDVYLAIAEGIREGRGFSSPGSTAPTAYRPPLYPLLLSPISGVNQYAARAALHCVLGGIAAALTVWLAATSRLSPRRQFLAGLIVAIDPLLVYYATFPMTETLAAALTAGLLATAAAACRSSVPRSQRNLSLIAGALFSLCVLCRPTYWAFAGCVVLFGAWQTWRGALPPAFQDMRSRKADWVIASLVSAAILLPWPIRNWLVMDRPILTTTHGGYTLLLGNNETYYREVVDQPLGTIWDGSHGNGQEVWAENVNAELDAAGVTGEVDRDRWMKNLAWDTIREEPVTFVKACLRRLLSFWSLSPRGTSRAETGTTVQRLVVAYYALLWAAMALGLWRAARYRGCAVELAALMLGAFVLVHLVYWTDARMRAPVMPAIALFVAWAGFAFPLSLQRDKSLAGESA